MRITQALMSLIAAAAAASFAQPPRPFQSQSPSTVTLTASPDGSKTVEIRNISYLLSSTQSAGKDERRLLRKTTSSKQILGDKGMEGTVTLEAWPLGSDPRQKPLYTLKATGADGQIVDTSLFVVSRGLEETDWWSVYKLNSGRHLFDTYVPLVSFSTSREELRTRYLGLDAPSDDVKDARLKQPKVIAVLTYASEDRVIAEWLLTCDDAKRAQLLRSYSDVTRKLTVADRGEAHVVTLSFRDNFPSPPNPLDISIPVLKDALDVAHAQMPPQVHLTAWQR